MRRGGFGVGCKDREGNGGMTARQPAEWAAHAATWTAFPSHAELWETALAPAQAEVAAMVRAIAKGERVDLLVANDKAAAAARTLLDGCDVQLHAYGFGDIWVRDTGPLFLQSPHGSAAAGFRFNGWGGKYDLPGDDGVAVFIAGQCSLPLARHGWVLEGGAIDVDGTGLVVTTEQCLLNPNRNPRMDRVEVESHLRRDLGLDRVLWLGEGLLNDHTDGHVDNLARFVGPGRLALPVAAGRDDPNREIYEDAWDRARDFGVEIVPIPSPGRVVVDGRIVPASHMNFYIANAVVVVPLYGTASDDDAVSAIAALFPDREVVGARADHILTGGGSFHCITQQQPK
jgi:agmatine deiminase